MGSVNTRIHCYDCGRGNFTNFDDGLLWCSHCAELVRPDERIGLLHAWLRRLLFRWHSNTDDLAARGWR